MLVVKKKEENLKTVLTQREIESRVHQNPIKYKDVIEQITSEIKSENLKKGRVRPKDSAEDRVLKQFKK